jgi:hypothetical protein
LRTLAYFGTWWLLLALFRRALTEPERLARVAAAGLIILGITATLAATDWVMSLLPQWHSTVFGMLLGTGWLLSAAALATYCATGSGAKWTALSPQLRTDLGTLLLTLTLVWAYLAFMQYLTVWIADLPADTSWYLPRTLTSWRLLAGFLIVFHFLVPCGVLLSRRAKQLRPWLAGIAALLLLAHLADALWLVVPNFRPSGLELMWTDLLAPLGIGAIWLQRFLGQQLSTAHV